jgi:peptide/nickel transport system substrate-binding protein
MKPFAKTFQSAPGPLSRRLGVGLVGVAVVLAAAGCSSSSKDGGTKVDLSGELVAQLPAAKGPVDRVVWNLTKGEPDTLDPRNAATYSGGQVVNNLCEPLVKVDAHYDLTPNLATYEQVSPTQLRYTLNGKAKFWDGKPVTAEDVAYSLQRAADPASIVSFIYANVKSIDVTGPQQVTVTFKAPDELFNNEMSTIAGLIVEKAFTEKAGKSVGTPAGGLMCSGPFKLVSWKSGDSIEITLNDDYWNAERRPLAKDVKFTFVTDTTAVTQALQSGEIDGAYELPASSLGSLSKAKSGRLVFGPSTQSTSLARANAGGVLADPRLMEALQLVIDRDGIAKAIYHGAATPLYSYLTPTTWPNDQKSPYQAAYDKLQRERTFDPAKAKKLVADSGYAGQPIVLAITAGDETQTRVAQLVQQQAQQAGITIKIRSLQPLVMSQATYDSKKRKGLDLLYSESFNGVQDPIEPLGFTFLPDGFYNYTAFSDPTVTDDLNKARQTFDDSERAKLIIAAQTIYEQANVSIQIVSNNTVTFLRKGLTGAVTSFAYWAMPQMAYVGGGDG